MKGIIKDKKEIATDTLQVIFETNEAFSFKAGQYCFVTLINPPYPDDRNNRRHFSIVNSPNQKGIVVIATRVRETGFKKSLKELPIGSVVELGPIAGAFTLPQDALKPLIFIAGGIGITPFISMLRYVSEQKLPYKITLIYSNRDKNSAVFLEELQNFEKSIPDFKLVLTMTADNSWDKEKRKVDANFIREYLPDVNSYAYFVVGPPPMVEAVQKTLLESGVSLENIKIENFTGY